MDEWSGDDRRRDQELPASFAKWTGKVEVKIEEMEKKIDKLVGVTEVLFTERNKQLGSWKTLVAVVSVASALSSCVSNKLINAFMGGQENERYYITTDQANWVRCNKSNGACVSDSGAIMVKQMVTTKR